MATSLKTKLSEVSSMSPEAERKVRDIIRKKALFYGIEELANPASYNKSNLLIALKGVNKEELRSRSSLGESMIKINSGRKQAQDGNSSNHLPLTIPSAPTIPNYKLDSKTNRQRVFPPLHNLSNLIHQQRQIIHVFKDKLDYDLNDIVFEYLKILQLAIEHESQTFRKSIHPEKGLVLPALELLVQTFAECQYHKLVLVLAVVGVALSEFYKELERVGKLLFAIAKVLRKMFRYEESVVTLKKALEYVWYGRKLQTKKKNHQSHKHHDKHPQLQKQHDQTKKHHQNRNEPHNNTVNMQNSTQSHHTNHQNPHKRHQSTLTVYEPDPIESLTSLELQIYNELSYCLLQLNLKKQSVTFAQKYEIGYLEKESTSSIMNLSHDLINSAQKRIVKWQRVDKRRFDLMLGLDLKQYLVKNQQAIKNKFNQTKLIQDMKVNIELLLQNFFKKDLFFYEVPLNTEMKDKDIELYKAHHKRNLPSLSSKFVYKKKSVSMDQRSSSLSNNLKKIKNENVGENKIFNYRGIGLSRSKLTNLLKEFIYLVRTRIGDEVSQGHTVKLPPINEKIEFSSKTKQNEHEANHEHINKHSHKKQDNLTHNHKTHETKEVSFKTQVQNEQL